LAAGSDDSASFAALVSVVPAIVIIVVWPSVVIVVRWPTVVIVVRWPSVVVAAVALPSPPAIVVVARVVVSTTTVLPWSAVWSWGPSRTEAAISSCDAGGQTAHCSSTHWDRSLAWPSILWDWNSENGWGNHSNAEKSERRHV